MTRVCPLALIAVCLLTAGCASAIRKPVDLRQGGPTQYVLVTSEPAGATVLLRGRVLGVTPARVVLNRKDTSQVLQLQKAGYRAVDVPIKRSVSPLIAGNLGWSAVALNPLNGPGGYSDNPWSRSKQVTYAVVFPAVGAGIDLLTGAAFNLPRHVHATLAAESR